MNGTTRQKENIDIQDLNKSLTNFNCDTKNNLLHSYRMHIFQGAHTIVSRTDNKTVFKLVPII